MISTEREKLIQRKPISLKSNLPPLPKLPAKAKDDSPPKDLNTPVSSKDGLFKWHHRVFSGSILVGVIAVGLIALGMLLPTVNLPIVLTGLVVFMIATIVAEIVWNNEATETEKTSLDGREPYSKEPAINVEKTIIQDGDLTSPNLRVSNPSLIAKFRNYWNDRAVSV